MEATTTTTTTANNNKNNSSSVRVLEEKLASILNQNFDEKTKICLVTTIKILDNIIQKPNEPKVRKLRLSNPTVQNKIGSCKGGIEFLLACGFEKQQQQQLLDGGNGEWFLVLPPPPDTDDNNGDNNRSSSSSFLITARRLLTKCCIQDLGMKSEDLPKHKPPPSAATATAAAASRQNSNSQQQAAFNPYQTHRYDGMSNAVGAQLTPDSTYVSTTDQQLKLLQQKQQKLERTLQKQTLAEDRNWFATHPVTSVSGSSSAAAAFAATTSGSNKGGGGGGGGGDSSLVMESYQKKIEQQKKAEAGFTTSNMRQLEKLKKTKVYSHVQLAIQLSNGITIHGKFLPKETLDTVISELVAHCFVLTPLSDKQQSLLQKNIQLYITPPRRVLNRTKTLAEEELVPAAKLFLKFQNNQQTIEDLIPRPHLFQQQQQQQQQQHQKSSLLPQSKPVVADKKNNNDSMDDDRNQKTAGTKKKSSKEEKEEDLMRRMMGGGGKRKKGGFLGGLKRK